MHVETADGNKADGVSAPKYDGKPVAVNGTLQWDTLAEKQIDANTVSEGKQGGNFRATRRISVSADGKTMTITTSGTGSDGKAFTQLSVFDKE